MTDKEMMKNIDKKAVGERIREIRLRQGLTLAAFGEQFCARKGNVQQWEIGVSLPSKKEWLKYVRLLTLH